MTFIDWSDPEEMLGLLAEYVADARIDSRTASARAASLENLLNDLAPRTRSVGDLSPDDALDRLRRIHAAHAEDLSGDPVLLHVEACIEELERIRRER